MLNGNRPGMRDHFVEMVGLFLMCFGFFVGGLWFAFNYIAFFAIGIICIVFGFLFALNNKVNKYAAKILKKFHKSP